MQIPGRKTVQGVKAFISKLFWGLVSNNEDQVSTGAALAISTVATWEWHFIYCTVHNLPLKVGPVELSALVTALMVVPKAAGYLGKKGNGQ